MSANIQTLITKSDNFELIRDEIAAILAVEIANQKALATIAEADTTLYDFDLFTERSDPWNLFFNDQNEIIRSKPVVNIFFESMSPNASKSNTIDQTDWTGTFSIDAISGKVNERNTSTNTMKYGDELSAKECQRIIKLCRNILQAGIYQYIFTGLSGAVPIAITGVVSKRVISQIQMFKPDLNDRPSEHIFGARITLSVDFVEYSPQYTGILLETLAAQCTRGEDGSIYFETTFK